MAEALANEQGHCAGKRGGDANERNCQKHVHFKRGEAYANGQGVNACRHCLEQQYGQCEGALRRGFFVFVFMEGVPDHFAADEAQDNEGDDTCVLRDDFAYQPAHAVADNGHKELEHAEGNGHGCLADAAEFGIGEGV